MSDMSMMPEYVQAQEGHKAKMRKAHRGRRAKGLKPNPPHGAPDHMHEANENLQRAKDAPTKQGTMAHVFKALNALKKVQK